MPKDNQKPDAVAEPTNTNAPVAQASKPEPKATSGKVSTSGDMTAMAFIRHTNPAMKSKIAEIAARSLDRKAKKQHGKTRLSQRQWEVLSKGGN